MKWKVQICKIHNNHTTKQKRYKFTHFKNAILLKIIFTILQNNYIKHSNVYQKYRRIPQTPK